MPVGTPKPQVRAISVLQNKVKHLYAKSFYGNAEPEQYLGVRKPRMKLQYLPPKKWQLGTTATHSNST